LGWCKSCIDVQGRMIASDHPTLDVYTGFTPSQLMTSTSGCVYSLLFSWWWAQEALETCRVYLQLLTKTNTAQSCILLVSYVL